jgi:hypothetical protein
MVIRGDRHGGIIVLAEPTLPVGTGQPTLLTRTPIGTGFYVREAGVMLPFGLRRPFPDKISDLDVAA